VATAEQYGVDIDCLNGHGFVWALASGPRNVANAIGRRLITPRGGLFYDPDYGFDVREYLGVALTRGKLAELIQGVESEALKDVRVQAVVAAVTVTGNPSTALKLSLSITLADGPAFDMILSIAALVPGSPTVTLDFALVA
jgi:phage baseplate assembly protein W